MAFSWISSLFCALSLWKNPTLFLEYPDLELSNNPGGELDATGGSWSKELDTHRQPTSGTEGRGDCLGRGELSSAKNPRNSTIWQQSFPDLPMSRPTSSRTDSPRLRPFLLVTLVGPFAGDLSNPVSRTRGVPESQRNRAVSRICRADASRKLSSD